MRAYKLTDANGRTYGDTQWGEGITHEAPGKGELCTEGWIHVYDDPLVAEFMNPSHGNFSNDKQLWECEWEGETLDDRGLKRGVQKCTTIRCIDVPVIAIEQRVRAAILVVKRVYHDENWNRWADDWLSGKDRTAAAAWAARAARAAAEAAAEAAAWAARAARAEAAAEAAAWAAREAAIDLPVIIRQAIAEEKV